MILPIYLYGSEVLRKVAEPVDPEEREDIVRLVPVPQRAFWSASLRARSAILVAIKFSALNGSGVDITMSVLG